MQLSFGSNFCPLLIIFGNHQRAHYLRGKKIGTYEVLRCLGEIISIMAIIRVFSETQRISTTLVDLSFN